MPTSKTFLFALTAMLMRSTAQGETPQHWRQQGRDALAAAKAQAPIPGKAKNVILFLGDGMGVATVTAARILDGQQKGQPGEENFLSFEKLPYSALIKTYNTNQQTPDSAGTMTAIVTGVKTKAGVISLDERVTVGDHASAAGRRLSTILEIAETAGLSTGVVTTTRLTHATPAACYAHSPDRDWESDADLPVSARAAGYPDIARQLIEFNVGDGLEVALGGGRSAFISRESADPEYPRMKGSRLDDRNLTAEWLKKTGAAYIWNREQFAAIDPVKVNHLLGLFEPSHMQYETDRTGDKAGEPSLSEMTAKAIDILSRSEKGYFLMVEGGRIDHAHHATNAYRALTDTIEFARAVATALGKVNREDTLVIVTADHSHVFTMAGYPVRGNPILGKVVTNDDSGNPKPAPEEDGLGLPYATLSYANGPGFVGASKDQPEGPKHYPHAGKGFKQATQGRPDLTSVDTTDHRHLQECTVPMSSETHGGEDVPLYADGPQAHLFRGVMEQNVIFYVMLEALGMRQTTE